MDGLIVPVDRRAFFRRIGAAGLAVMATPATPLAVLGLSAALFPKEASAVTTDNIAYGSYAAMTVTNLQSLASDATDPFSSWQSARVDNQTSVKADDFEIVAHLPMANTAAANDKSAYVYLVPWVTTDDGSTWLAGGNFSTTTAPTGSEGTASLSDPNSMKGPIALPYITQQQNINGYFTVSQLCGGIVPDGWSLAIRNCTGAAFSTGCVVAYRPITYTNS